MTMRLVREKRRCRTTANRLLIPARGDDQVFHAQIFVACEIRVVVGVGADQKADWPNRQIDDRLFATDDA